MTKPSNLPAALRGVQRLEREVGVLKWELGLLTRRLIDSRLHQSKRGVTHSQEQSQGNDLNPLLIGSSSSASNRVTGSSSPSKKTSDREKILAANKKIRDLQSEKDLLRLQIDSLNQQLARRREGEEIVQAASLGPSEGRFDALSTKKI